MCTRCGYAYYGKQDCRRVLKVLGKGLAKYGLTLHPEKTRMVDFRFKRPGGQRPLATRATSFDFLGFPHVWGKSRRGKNVVYQCTAKSRYARAVKAVWEWCKRNRHRSLAEPHGRLSRMMRRHYAYYGITGNSRRLRWYAHQVERAGYRWLSERTRSGRVRWDRFQELLGRYALSRPRIIHSYVAASETPP